MTPNKTLGDLKADVAMWLNRDDPEVVNAIPSFISLAEQEFSRVVKIPMAEGQMIYNAVGGGTFTEGVPIPEDMLSPIGVSVADLNTGKVQSYDRVDGYAMFNIVAADEKKDIVFCKFENNFLFYPALEVGNLVNIAYHKDLTPLNSDSDNSPALTYGYDLMLYWSLKHASVFLDDIDGEQRWAEKASDALTTMTSTFDEMHWSGSPLYILNS